MAEDIPERARELLTQALASIHAPVAAVITAAAAVDAMLKERGLIDGKLYPRIDKAAADHIITADMAAWAHEVRLDANAQRHADLEVALPTEDDASRSVEFAIALAEYLFVLPGRVAKGREKRDAPPPS